MSRNLWAKPLDTDIGIGSVRGATAASRRMKKILQLVVGVVTLFLGVSPEHASAACDSSKNQANVRHAITVNGGGRVEGSLQQMTGESVTLNGSSVITGDILVPGLPTIRLNGSNQYQGTLVGTGLQSPTNYQITFNGNVTLRHIVTRTNPIPLPVVAAPPIPSGTRSVSIKPGKGNDSAGDFTTVRNLNVDGNIGQFTVPPGTYGDFTANGNNGFTLGQVGVTTPLVYNFQRLTVNGNGKLVVLSPVIINVGSDFIANGTVGASANPSWLQIKTVGAFNVNGNCKGYGKILCPNGTFVLNGKSEWTGSLSCDRLIVNNGCVLRLVSDNGVPVAEPQSLSTPFNTAVAILLVGNDPDSDPLTYAIKSTPCHGTLAGFDAETGLVTYQPASGFSGIDKFDFFASDGVCQSDPVTVTITVASPPVPPVVRPDTYTLDEDTVLNVPAPGVLSNDSDLAGRPLSSSLMVGALKGTAVVGSNGAFIYTPKLNYFGSDSFVYNASNGALSAYTTVNLTILPVNDAPVASPQLLQTKQNTSLSITLSATDVDDTELTYTIESQPVHGFVVGTGVSVTYLPEANFHGRDEFTFAATDPHGSKGTAKIQIDVGSVNIAPVALFAAQISGGQAPFPISLDGRSSYDLDGQVVRYQWDFNNDGQFDAEGPTPTYSYDGQNSINVRLVVTDDQGGTGSVSRTLVFNLPPTVQIKTPAHLSAFFDDEPIDVKIDARDPEGALERTEVFLGSNLVGTLTGGTNILPLGVLPPGQYSVMAKAYDILGAQGVSIPILFEVRHRDGNFIVYPLKRDAKLLAVPGLSGPNGDLSGTKVNTTHQPLYAENYYTQPVDYTLTLINNRANSQSDYLVYDSRTSSEITYQWNDIAAPENRLEQITNTDDGAELVILPFNFNFYGKDYGQLFACSNGFLTFGPESTQSYNRGMPSTESPLAIIAPFWDDLNPIAETGSGGYYGGVSRDQGAIYYKEYPDRVVFQFSGDVGGGGGPVDMASILGEGTKSRATKQLAGLLSGTLISSAYAQQSTPTDNLSTNCGISRYGGDGCFNFQVVLYRSGDIDFYYQSMSGVMWDSTTGIQNADATKGVQLAYNTPYVESFMAVRFKHQAVGDPWFTVDKTAGHLLTGDKDQLDITYYAKSDFPPGRYEGQIRVDHNQPGLDPYFVNVSLEISQQEPIVIFTQPNPEKKQYYINGQPIPLRLEAVDGDGFITKVELAVDGQPLAALSSSPYTYTWQNPTLGEHVITAVATDNDGKQGNAVPVTISVSADSDGDLLPDAWEIDYFGDLSQTGTGDIDGDGRSNRKEFVAGSSPLSYDSTPLPNLPPAAKMSVSRLSGEAPFQVLFDASGSSDPDGTVVAWLWDMDGDGVFETSGRSVTQSFSQAGRFPITLKVVDDEGAEATTMVQVDVKAAGTALVPLAKFEAVPYINSAAQMVKFDASDSSDPDGIVQAYEWDFGDGSLGAGIAPEHLYTSVGIYPIKLTVTDNDGKSSSFTKYVTLTHHNQSAFTETDGFIAMEGEHFTGTDRRQDFAGWKSYAYSSRGGLGAQYDTPYEVVTTAYTTNGIGWDGGTYLARESLTWDKASEVSWLVNITTPGLYYYAVRVIASGSADTASTIMAGVDGVQMSPEGGDWMGLGTWPTWRRGHDLGFLTAGLHLIQIRRGRNVVEIDQIVLSTDKVRLPAADSHDVVSQVATRNNQPRSMPRAAIKQLATDMDIPFVGTFDALPSEAIGGRIVRYNWFVDKLVPELGSFEYNKTKLLSEEPTLTLRLDDFNGYAFSGSSQWVLQQNDLDKYALRLVVEDDLGRKTETSRAINLADPIERIMQGSDLVVDNTDAGFSSSGDWKIATASSVWSQGGYYQNGWSQFMLENPGLPMFAVITGDQLMASRFEGVNYVVNRGGLADSRVRFTPTVTEEGDYFVFFKFPAVTFSGFFKMQPHPSGERVPVLIHSADGESTVYIDERIGGGHWRAIGVRHFASGQQGYVEVGGAGQNRLALADSVRLVRLPALQPQRPTSSFLVSSISPKGEVSFDGSASISSNGKIIGYLWDFGDGRQSRSDKPIHHFDQSGSYTVKLTVIDQQLAWQVSEQSVVVPAIPTNELPLARMTLSSRRGKIPFTVQADGSLSTDDYGIAAFAWHTDEDFSTSGPSPLLTFGTPGIHTVTLTVTDIHGQTDSVTLSLEAVPDGYALGEETVVDSKNRTAISKSGTWLEVDGDQPDGFFQSQAIGDSITVTPYLPRAGLYQIFWQYRNAATTDVPVRVQVNHLGGSSTIQFNNSRQPEQWYPFGTFLCGNGEQSSVILKRERDGQSLDFVAMKWVAVDAGASADFTYSQDQNQAPATALFDASASVSQIGIVSYMWEFGDGSTGAGVASSHTYASGGVFAAKLTVIDARGASAVTIRPVRIESPNSAPVPVIQILPSSGAAPLTVSFDASGSTDSDGIVAYLWDFGDGASFAGPKGSHQFSSVGTYTVRLTVVDGRSGSSQATSVVQVLAPPPESPAGIDTTRSDTDPFTVNVGVPSIPGAAYSWSFGDGQTASGPSTSHQYGSVGTYELVLTVTMPDGSVWTLRQFVSVPGTGGPSTPPDGPHADPGAELILYTPLTKA